MKHNSSVLLPDNKIGNECSLVLCNNRKSVIIAVINIITIMIIKFFIIMIGETTLIHCKNFAFVVEIEICYQSWSFNIDMVDCVSTKHRK